MRWDILGDYLVLHGFDAIAEVIDGLKQRNAGRTNRHFHAFAVGAVDGEREFYLNPSNPTASSMFRQRDDRFDTAVSEQPRKVPVRRLDSLLAAGVIPKCDFLKVDVEGFEQDVFRGARDLLAAGVLGVETETSFGVSPVYPKSHLVTIAEIVLEHHLLLFDLGFNRIPHASFQRALARKGIECDVASNVLGKPATFNVLFCRELIDEVDHQDNYATPPPPVSVDQMIKTMIICELHGLNDIALDIADRFADKLGSRLDVEAAITLADPQCREVGRSSTWCACSNASASSSNRRAGASPRRCGRCGASSARTSSHPKFADISALMRTRFRALGLDDPFRVSGARRPCGSAR